MFENSSKCPISRFVFCHFLPIFILLKVVTLFDRKLQVFKNSPQMDHFKLTQNVNVARFARNIECDFSVIFKHRVCGVTTSLRFFFVKIPKNWNFFRQEYSL